MVQNQITVSLCLTTAICCWVLHGAYCEAVRSAILATAWLLVDIVHYLQLDFNSLIACIY